MEKEILKIIAIIIGGIIGIIMLIYLFIGFIDWIFTDPFNIISPTPQTKTEISINICEEKGGVPIISEWTGTLKECKFYD